MLATEGPTYIRGELDIDFHGLLPNVGTTSHGAPHRKADARVNGC